MSTVAQTLSTPRTQKLRGFVKPARAHELKEQGYEIDRRQIILREPIKRFGNYTVPIRLHREITVELPVSVLGEGGIEIDVAALRQHIKGLFRDRQPVQLAAMHAVD